MIFFEIYSSPFERNNPNVLKLNNESAKPQTRGKPQNDYLMGVFPLIPGFFIFSRRTTFFEMYN
jgi:hypothetical protein